MSSIAKASFTRREAKAGKMGNSSSHANKTNFSPPVNSPIDQITFLQRTVGNREVERLLESGVLSPSSHSDSLEPSQLFNHPPFCHPL
jgi:hypothetical protein